MELSAVDHASASASDVSPSRTPFGRVLVLLTEDWFALSHFKPLLAELRSLAREVVVVTHSSGRIGELAALGVRTIEFDFRRSSLDPLAQARAIRGLGRLISTEKPEVIHAISMQTMVVACAALQFTPAVPHVVLHLTGLGYLGISETRPARILRPIALRLLGTILKRPGNWLLAENPDDAEFLLARGANPGPRVRILGGAGIDENEFPALPAPDNPVPVAAFVGRMVRSKGVDVLIEAQRLLAARGVALDTALYGKSDENSKGGLDRAQLEEWGRRGGITWHGHVTDIRNVWARNDIAVLPAVTREGLPRSLLEAAACGRPLITTDVPGCNHFVRDGIDGLIVPPGDAMALADALERLATSPELRRRMGAAARERVLEGFTTVVVRRTIRETYLAMARQ